MKRSTSGLLALAALTLPVAAFAHPGHDLTGSAVSGLLHPLTGIDHLAALLAAGAWAAQQRGSARAMVPAAFLAAMLAGALLALGQPGGTATPGLVEQGIAASLLALGLLLAGAWPLPAAGGLAVIAGFALFHGFAHGAELPVGATVLPFAAGFLSVSALLLGAGYAAGRRCAGSPWLRGAGALLTLSGIALFA